MPIHRRVLGVGLALALGSSFCFAASSCTLESGGEPNGVMADTSDDEEDFEGEAEKVARDLPRVSPAGAMASAPATSGSPRRRAYMKPKTHADAPDDLLGGSLAPMGRAPAGKKPVARTPSAYRTTAPYGGLRADGSYGDTGTEEYVDPGVNDWYETRADPLATFAVDVDSASYTIARRKLLEGTLPPPSAVRVEEWVNYFKYNYPGPDGATPFAVHLEAAPSPFSSGKHLLRVGIQGKILSRSERKPVHLVFLVDTSGSMMAPDKLGLAKRALRILVDNLQDGDTVALTTYAGSVRRVLDPTGVEKKAEIHAAIEALTAGGSTAMGDGLTLAYDVAARTLSDDSVTRVIVLSDGDANVGATSYEEILETIKGHVSEGVTLSTIGFGMGNYKDAMMEGLANKGNGNYYYIDGISEARRIFQEQLGGTLEIIAKDVKIQVELNPDAIARYRLLGYENRAIADSDFRKDEVDAGEIGAGHRVTAVFEVELTGKAKKSARLATVRLRHKKPRGVKAIETSYPLLASAVRPTFTAADSDFRFAVAVAASAEILRRSPHAEGWNLERVASIAAGATPADSAERKEFLALLERARALELPPIAAR